MTSAGTKTVTVSYSGISTSYSIQVTDLWISLSCDTSGANSGYITFSSSVPCGYVNWSSSDTGVASVNSSGVATFGSTMGTTTITATVNNNGCTQSASGTLTLSNYSGTKYKETSATSYSNVLYGSHSDGYDTAHPVTGSIPSYTTNAADVSWQSTNTSTGRVDTSFSQTGVAGRIYYQFNYSSTSGGNNENKIIHYKEDWRCNMAADSSHNYYHYTKYGRQFYSSTDYPEHASNATWTKYYANWWAYQDKQAGHTWYVAKDISGALAASWCRFPLYN